MIRHFDALHACCSDDLFIRCLYADHKIYILLADTVLIDLFELIDFVKANRLKDVVLTTHLTEILKYLKVDLSFDISADCRKIDRINKY